MGVSYVRKEGTTFDGIFHITILAKDKDIVFPQERREVYLISFGIVKQKVFHGQ